MAGRGTDIVLGGKSDNTENWESEHKSVIDLGGLHVIGVEHYDSRRIDNQLRGRAGRQGDPGTSQFYVSLEDDLMQRFGGERIKSVMSWTGLEEDIPIENKLITRSIRGAQVKVEGYHFDIRKHLLNYDDVLNNQRTVIYQERNDILDSSDLKNKIKTLLCDEYDAIVDQYLSGHNSDFWDYDAFYAELGAISTVPEEIIEEESLAQLDQKYVKDVLHDHSEEVYLEKEQELTQDNMVLASRILLLKSIDTRWLSHLTTMENLRTGVGLHAYGQRDPLIVYKTEGFKLFTELLTRIRSDMLKSLFNVHIEAGQAPIPRQKSPKLVVDTTGKKIGRNESCPCGSGKKYKRCCG